MEAQVVEPVFEDSEQSEEEDEGFDDDSDEEEDAEPQAPWGQPQWDALYNAHMVGKGIRVERSVKLSVFPNVINQLTSRNWLGIGNLENLCYDEFVRWFFASAIKNGKNCIIARVRNVQVLLTPRIIAEAIGAPSVPCPTYPIKNINFDKPEGKRFIREVGMELTGDKHVSFANLAQGALTLDYKFLHVLVTYNLLPVGRYSTVSWERGLFMYCVMKGYSIDLPQVIFDYIYSFINVHRQDDNVLPFGTLISKVCMRAGVQVNVTDVSSPREGPIGRRTFKEKPASTAGASTSTSAVGSVHETWMDQRPSLTPMSACSNMNDLIGAMSTFKMEQNEVNHYTHRYLDAIFRQRSPDDTP